MNQLKFALLPLLFALILPLQLAFGGTNLNTASPSELEALPGVGAKLAQQIVAARPFKSVDDLKSVKGIGGAKFKKLQPLVEVSGDTAPTAAAPVNAATHSTANATSTGTTRTTRSELAANEKINLNTASKADLERLPGIGEKKADAIIQARPFKAPEDILKVKGIKQGIYNKIKDHITTG